MNVQISVTNTLSTQRGLKANVLVYDGQGNVYSKSTITAGNPTDTVVANVVVPLGGSVGLTKFVPTPMYDANQRAAVPGP